MLSFDLADKLTTAGLSLSSVLFYIFYNNYKNRQITGDQVKSSVNVVIDKDLVEQLENLPEHRISYAQVEGIVTAVGETLFSQYDSSKEGVLRHSTLEEHKSKRINGFWSDTKRSIRDVFDSVKFHLRSHTQDGGEVMVTEIGEAKFVRDELAVTHDYFEPNKSSLLQIGLDRVFGEVTKGLHEREYMLLVGTQLLGFGELILEKGKLKLGPAEGSKYILTKLSKREVIKKLESQSNIFKYLMIISGLVSTGCLAYLIWKFTKKYFEQLRNRQIFENARSGYDAAGTNGEVNECVICLTNPRDVVILNCGHVALCSRCAEVLPNLTCPVCRGEITRFVPLYQS